MRYIPFLTCLMVMKSLSMEQIPKGEEGFFVGGGTNPCVLSEIRLDQDSTDTLAPPTAEEIDRARSDLRQHLDLVVGDSPDNVPYTILEIDPGVVRRWLVSTRFYTKQTLGTAAAVWTTVRSYVPLPYIQSASASTASSYVEMIIEGDRFNFPDVSLKYIFSVFDDDPDRETFKKYYLYQRAFPFAGEGFNGVSTGYMGYAVIKDFAYGHRPMQLRDEEKVLSTYHEDKRKTRLDFLIALRENISVKSWLEMRFVRSNPMNLRKLHHPYKDIWGRTCLLYELVADPQGLLIEVMRVPKLEYEQLISQYKEQWNEKHKRDKSL